MEILAKVIQFFICFTLLVGVHEFGHFIAARIFKMRVEKFYILFDPWFSLFKIKRGDTEYGLGWLPLGGYCKISGMIDESMDTEMMAEPPKPYEFRSKPAWQRLIVMVAGVVMNLLLAIVLYIGISYTWGDSYISADSAKWGYNFSDAGKKLGFKDGDMIISIDGDKIDDISEITTKLLLSKNDRQVAIYRGARRYTIQIPLELLIEMRKEKEYNDLYTLRMPFIIDSITTEGRTAEILRAGDEIISMNDVRRGDFTEYTEIINGAKGKDVNVIILRGKEIVRATLPVDEDGKIGVILRNPYKLEVRKYTLLQAIPAGFKRAGAAVSSYWNQLKLIFQPKTEMYRELGGFMAIGNMFSSVWNWQDFWLKTAFLSIILAVMNILPIPGLDGGHSLFAIYEIVTRRKPSDKFLEVAQYIGMAIIFTLMLYANGNDLYRFFF
ncbi:MAG: RIP metalloprotease RseP [Rikenellaceae bacterium]